MAIDGVRVLAQEAIMEMPNWAVWVNIISISIVAILFILNMVVKNTEICFKIAFCILLLALVFDLVGLTGIFNTPTPRNTYKCIFDEDVSIQEIYDNYNIVGRDGEIWILEDKE